jgi:hypothetical protein
MVFRGGPDTYLRDVNPLTQGWQIDPAEVEAAVRPGETRYMVINEPYNPAGTVMSREVQAALVAIAKKHGITLMSDEVYRLLEHDEADRLPAMADAYERGISAVTMSKPVRSNPQPRQGISADSLRSRSGAAAASPSAGSRSRTWRSSSGSWTCSTSGRLVPAAPRSCRPWCVI